MSDSKADVTVTTDNALQDFVLDVPAALAALGFTTDDE